MLSANIAIVIIEILLDIIMFNIIYSTLNSGVGYLKNVFIYTCGMIIKQIVGTGIIFYYPTAIFVFGNIFLVRFIIFFIIGLALIYLLEELIYISRTRFIIISMFIQFAIISLLNLFI